MESSNDIVTMRVTEQQTAQSLNRIAVKTRSIKKILRPKVAIRMVGICFFGCLTGYLIFDSPYWLAGLWTALVTAHLFYDTVRFVDQSERKLASFLQALSQNDFSMTFHENKKSDEYDLHRAFNQLNETFKVLRSDKESQHQFLQIIVSTAAVPMICFEEGTGKVSLINDAAKKLLGIPVLQHVRALWRADPTLPSFVREIRDGDKETFKLMSNSKPLTLSVTSRHILFQEKNLKVVAFHDVSSELAIKEAETWQKLLRVLTHEISNSAIPLSTLSSFTHDLMLETERQRRILTKEETEDIMSSLRTIDERSRSLKEFVTNFRAVNQVPEPVLQRISVMTLMDEVYQLFKKETEKENIHFGIADRKDACTVLADKNLTMQVMINVVTNAIEAMANMKVNKTLLLDAEKAGRYVHLSVSDTGCGIAPEDVEQIFIPFYSTKKAGSGIGLSVSQQIMQKQKGDISVRSIPGKGSEFILTFSS